MCNGLKKVISDILIIFVISLITLYFKLTKVKLLVRHLILGISK